VRFAVKILTGKDAKKCDKRRQEKAELPAAKILDTNLIGVMISP
jgi:hypothetical protein